jgi:hypothetical protein
MKAGARTEAIDPRISSGFAVSSARSTWLASTARAGGISLSGIDDRPLPRRTRSVWRRYHLTQARRRSGSMPTNQNTQWTDAQDALLRQLALTKRVSIIAAGLKRSAAVKGRASRYWASR